MQSCNNKRAQNCYLSLMKCNQCPRKCNADRSSGASGWCRLDDEIHIASICLHYGEEPPLSRENGIVNVFFEHCNMQCVYCQNHSISDNCKETGVPLSLEEVCDHICTLLSRSEGNLGFVSPSHCIRQVKRIIEELHHRSVFPVVIYNCNGYDNVDAIRSLEGLVDVWLPDFKYSDDLMAEQLSSAPGYSAAALASLKEMMRQCGVTLQTNEKGIAIRGIIVRHLVLPGATENSIGVLKLIAEELSPNLHISLMSQYFPPERDHSGRGINRQMQRTINREEYESVIEAFYALGFHRGWLQEYDSHRCYIPDFSKKNPFE